MKKEYIEWEGVKLIIKEKAMKSNKNQFNTVSKIEKTPFKRKDVVTFELNVKCLIGAFSWGALIYALLNFMG